MKTIEMLKIVAADMVRQRLQGGPSSIEIELADRGSVFFVGKWWEREDAQDQAAFALLQEMDLPDILDELLSLCLDMGAGIRSLDKRNALIHYWPRRSTTELGSKYIQDVRFIEATIAMNEIGEFVMDVLATKVAEVLSVVDEYLRL